MKKKLITLHPPKTAGRSLDQAIKDANARPPNCAGNHKKIRDRIPQSLWGKHVAVLTTRNPYDRLYSIFEFFKKKRNNIIEHSVDFEEFVLKYESKYMGTAPWFSTCYDFIKDDPNQENQLEVLRFENFEEDFAKLCRKYRILNKLRHMNKNERKDFPEKATLYTKDMRVVVERAFKEDLQRFGYSYEQWLNTPWNK